MIEYPVSNIAKENDSLPSFIGVNAAVIQHQTRQEGGAAEVRDIQDDITGNGDAKIGITKLVETESRREKVTSRKN